MMPRTFMAVVFCVTGATAARAEPSPVGQWNRGDGRAIVLVETCGTALCATNTWIAAGTQGEHIGDRLIMNVKQDGQFRYSGTADDPQRNLTYTLKIDLAGQTMTTRGCVLLGLLCKNMNWSRVGANQRP